MTAREIVQRQLDFYNKHDLDGFCSMYSEDIQVFSFGSAAPDFSGMKDFRERYARRFEIEGLRAEVMTRIVKDDIVIDEERIRGLEESPNTVIGIYEVKDGLIKRATFLR